MSYIEHGGATIVQELSYLYSTTSLGRGWNHGQALQSLTKASKKLVFFLIYANHWYGSREEPMKGG